MRKGPWSIPRITARRLSWGEEHHEMAERWKMVIFSDEKKFNLDGPDGLNYYWHDLRKEKIRFSKRQSGGGGLMFWGGLGVRGLTPLVNIKGKLNSATYQQMLTSYLIPNAANISGPNFVFQQDGASCHRSHSTAAWLERRKIEVLDWPAYSPDMNITENLWGYMVRKVYPDGKQYSNLQSLEMACRQVWDEIDQNYIDSLFQSLPKRVDDLVQNHGGPTSY
jgi:hypothetical protein